MSLNKQDLEGAKKFRDYCLDAIVDWLKIYDNRWFTGFMFVVRDFINNCWKDFCEIAEKENKPDVDLS